MKYKTEPSQQRSDFYGSGVQNEQLIQELRKKVDTLTTELLGAATIFMFSLCEVYV